MSSLTHFTTQINPAVIWLLVCGALSLVATIAFLLLCRVGSRLSTCEPNEDTL